MTGLLEVASNKIGQISKNTVVVLLRNTTVAPVIYAMIIPLTFVDVTIFLYEHLCFRVYGIPIVRRKNYFMIDRHHLSYLKGLQKINCVYCGYANGLAAYAKEIIGRTEEYWCPIKHKYQVEDPHSRYDNFYEYGDEEGLRNHLDNVPHLNNKA
jgi:hypothetical protein